MHFNVSVTSRDLETSRSRLEIWTSRLGLVSAGEANVLVSSWSWEANVSVSSQSRPVTSRAHPWAYRCIAMWWLCDSSVGWMPRAAISCRMPRSFRLWECSQLLFFNVLLYKSFLRLMIFFQKWKHFRLNMPETCYNSVQTTINHTNSINALLSANMSHMENKDKACQYSAYILQILLCTKKTNEKWICKYSNCM